MSEKLLFASRKDFRSWLTKNAKTGNGIWLVMGKTAQLKTIKAGEALEEALCFGWIDGQIKSVDETRYLKYFSLRRKDSLWSARNRKLAEKLCAKRLMTKLGLAAIHQAKEKGKWNQAAARPDYAQMIERFQSVIKENQVACANFTKAPASYQKQIVGFYFNAKQEETRRKRLAKIAAVLQENKRTVLF